MNVYLVSSTGEEPDTYASFVCFAENDRTARYMHPVAGVVWDHASNTWYEKEYDAENDEWPDTPEDVTVELLGTAKAGSRQRVITASFVAL